MCGICTVPREVDLAPAEEPEEKLVVSVVTDPLKRAIDLIPSQDLPVLMKRFIDDVEAFLIPKAQLNGKEVIIEGS